MKPFTASSLIYLSFWRWSRPWQGQRRGQPKSKNHLSPLQPPKPRRRVAAGAAAFIRQVSAANVYALANGPDGSLTSEACSSLPAVVANDVARWDGSTSSWHSLGSGIGGTTPPIYALAVGPDGSLYAGRCFSTAGGVAAYSIARWDGTSWHPLGSGMEGCAFGVASSLWRWVRMAHSTPGAFHHRRWSRCPPHRTLGWLAWLPLGSGMSEYV